MPVYPHYADASGTIETDVETAFDFLDDQANHSAHMSHSSGVMLGPTMDIHMEPDHTRRAGSRFGFTGRILGVPLSVEEIVAEGGPPLSKSWETTSEPRLWVIGAYQMGFHLTPMEGRSSLRVHIRYDLPASSVSRPLGILFGRFYANWCTGKMVDDARKHFARSGEARSIPA